MILLMTIYQWFVMKLYNKVFIFVINNLLQKPNLLTVKNYYTAYYCYIVMTFCL